MTWPDVRRALRRIPWTQPIPSRATPTARLTVHLRVPACADFLTLPLWPNGAPT